MNHIEYDAIRQRNIEMLVLVICTLYTLGFSILITFNRWAAWDLVAIIVFIVLAWVFFIIKYRDYRFRAYLTFIMLQISMAVYLLHVDNVTETFAIMIALSFVIALYGFPNLVWVAFGAYTFEIAYHIVFTKQIHFTGSLGDTRLVFQIMSIYMVLFAVYYVICRQGEISEEQEERIEELKDAERSKDDFLANVSHEIRTPINTICGMSETVLREEIPEYLREEVFSIQNAGQNLLSVVSDILDFSELQSDDVELVEEEYNIASLANDVINLSVAKKDEKHIELVVDLDSTLPCGMVGDEQKIRRVIMNLVNNAIKYTDEGCVSIIFSYRREEYGVNLTVTVRDTGIGMKKEHIEKIFTMFSQIDSTRNRQESGIGLGLAISKAIITKMGGFILVQSEEGKGTEVQITIPQKVTNWEPIASVKNGAAHNVAVYINMEQFAMVEIRDEYAAVMQRMVTLTGVSCHVCQNLQELKRIAEREYLTHVFISVLEYLEDQGFFDQMAGHAQVMVILDHYDEDKVVNEKLLRIYKPLFILPVIMALNGERAAWGSDINLYRRGKFVAPTAKILAVDDNRMNLKVLENLLKPYEIQIVSVTSGAKALERIASKDFDFVFLDHMMPEMDGIETLKRIRSTPGTYYRKVPLVALTANSVAGMRQMFLKEGFNGFLSKPIEISAMERMLRRFIPEYKLVNRRDMDKQPAEEEQKTAAVETKAKDAADLDLQDIDIQMGILYCGSPDSYIEVLQMHSADGPANRDVIQRLFEEQNWKEYSIYVHALKSSMMSIGAVRLSEMAKKLEAASKEENTDYILSAHDQMMQEYLRVLDILKNNERIHVKKEKPQQEEAKEPVSDRSALSDEEFDGLAARLEDAAYTLDQETMLQIVDQLSECAYHGHNLDTAMESIRKKTEMEDYMSALDAVCKMKDEWSKD